MSKILIVDDCAQIRETLAGMLKGAGHAPHEADDGETALAALHRERFDLVITDIVMAGMDGLTFMGALSRQGATVPVIAISGGDGITPTSTLMSLSAAFGASRTLYKPFTRGELLACITEVLGTPVPAAPV